MAGEHGRRQPSIIWHRIRVRRGAVAGFLHRSDLSGDVIMSSLSSMHPVRPASPYAVGTVTVGREAVAVRCLPILSIAALLEPDMAAPADDVPGATDYLGLLDEPGLGLDGRVESDVADAADSFLARPPRPPRRGRAVTSRARFFRQPG